MSEIIRVTQEELKEKIGGYLEFLRQTPGWPDWIAHCCLYCADAPSSEAMDKLEALNTAMWLLDGSGWRDLYED